jgi:8-oxo-dGTP pyrophosphatase MutT (NUDIX family)
MGQDVFSLALAAPPDLSRLTVSQILARDTFLDDRFPFVLAADPSGLLLITDSYGRATDPLGTDLPVYLVWDATTLVTHRLRRHQECVNHSGNVGLFITPDSIYGRSFMVVELLPVSAGESITILCYKSDSHLWVKKTLSSSMPHYPWSSANVFSYNSKLWWVDLRHGILSCDPLADTPEFLLVRFPGGAAEAGTTPLVRRRDISKLRCVNLSDGKLRFLEMTGSAYMPRVAMWTLVDPEASAWDLDYDVKLREIWADESYEETGLPKKRPVIAGVHPADPTVVYFLNKEKLFGVNLGTKKVDQCVAFQPAATDPTALDIDEESSRFLLTWDLPPSLTSSSGA